MKKAYILSLILTVTMFILSGCFIAVMPDQVPLHFNLDGVPDRIGDPIEYMFMPIIGFLVSLLFCVTSWVNKQRGLEDDARQGVYLNVAAMLFLNIVNMLICVNAFIYGKDNAYVQPGFMHTIIFVALGLFQIYLSKWISDLPYHANKFKEANGSAMSEDVYHAKLKRIKQIGMLVGGLITISALLLPLNPELVVVSVLYLAWTIYGMVSLRTTRITLGE